MDVNANQEESNEDSLQVASLRRVYNNMSNGDREKVITLLAKGVNYGWTALKSIDNYIQQQKEEIIGSAYEYLKSKSLTGVSNKEIWGVDGEFEYIVAYLMSSHNTYMYYYRTGRFRFIQSEPPDTLKDELIKIGQEFYGNPEYPWNK